MPAMHLISVDLPAPLSPTSAITSPSRTSKSTSVSACTEPKCLLSPRTSSVGIAVVDSAAVVAVAVTSASSGRGALAAPRPGWSLLAELLELPVADVALLQEPAREEDLVVLLRDRLRRDQDRGLEAASLRLDGTPGRQLLALDDLHRGLR